MNQATHNSSLTIAAIVGLTAAALQEANPGLHAQLLSEGASAERQRIADVEAQALPGHETLIAKLKADGISTGADAAMQVLAAEKTSRAKFLQSLHADAPPPVPHAPAPTAESGAQDINLPLETRCKRQWETDAQLRAEFSSVDTYIAFERAQAAGHAKIFSR